MSLDDFKVSEKSVEAALTPSSDIAKEYMNPVQDDTWVRHAEFVRVEQLKESQEESAAKEALLRGYAADQTKRTAVSTTQAGDSEVAQMVDGMEWKEKLMEEYKQSDHGQDDKARAVTYKNQMLENFRKKQQAARS